MKKIIPVFVVLVTAGAMSVAVDVRAAPSQLGSEGTVNMPSARIAPEGTLRFGYAVMDPYYALWSSLSIFPRLELAARYTEIDGVDTGSGIWSGYGDYKDKAFDAKLMLWRESRYLPEISIGTQDFLGTKILEANYLVASKRFGDVDLSLGYGDGRIDGWFGGLRYQPTWLGDFALVAEYDAIDYANDFAAATSGAAGRDGGWTYALEYRWGWLGAQLSGQGGEVGFNAYVSIPLNQREFIPKIEEPEWYSRVTPAVSQADWHADPRHARDLIKSLETQGYRNVRVRYQGEMLEVGFAHPRISVIGRAVGRAARTALLMAPMGTKAIRVTYYNANDLAVATYDFHDLQGLQNYFAGQFGYLGLLQYFTVSYSDPAYSASLIGDHLWAPDEDVAAVDTGLQVKTQEDGQMVSVTQEDRRLSRFSLQPFNLGLFFNDPSGALKYDTFALARYTRYLAPGLFLDAAARLQLWENVSDVPDDPDSNLPHVRTDVAQYKQEDRLRLNNLVLSRYLHLRPRVYGRLSAGWYEEMFGGLGGQVLYLPHQRNWAVDLAVDHVWQREPGATLAFRDYDVTTALLSAHYRVPAYGVTFTLRGGQFLAGDVGARFELQRRFNSGIRLGFWYTVTDGDDITGPGSPGDPYYDKGIFMTIPLGSMLTRDTAAVARGAIAPWTRDVGQMVRSPGDLYTIMEDALLLDKPGMHLLSDFEK